MWFRQGIADHAFAAFQRLFFACLVGCHFAIGSFGVLSAYGLTDGYGKLPAHTLSYTYHTLTGAPRSPQHVPPHGRPLPCRKSEAMQDA